MVMKIDVGNKQNDKLVTLKKKTDDANYQNKRNLLDLLLVTKIQHLERGL